jgi:hypothetical protein
MKRKQVKELAEEFIDALHALEEHGEERLDAIVDLFADNASLTNAALDGKELSGTDGVRQFWSEYRKTFGDVRSEFSHVLVSDEAAGLFWRTEATSRNGNTLAYHGVSLLEYSDDGMISFFRGYYDTRELGRELNVAQEPTAQERGADPQS